jgi:hypothetical protein
MNCHEPNTNFKLLGYFKAPQYAEWFEQLFKHEGNCVWEDEEYEFMQRYREAWPEYCTMSAVRDDGSATGNYLYYDTKPSAYATMDIGLYTDDRCIVEYKGNISVQTVLDTNTTYDDDDGGSGGEGSAYDLVEELQAWNEAFGIFKTCLPCKTFDMNSLRIGYHDQKSGNNSLRYGFWEGDDDDDGGGSGDEYFNDGGLRCRDDAGYQNVNQCMKFATQTRIIPADLNDVILAENQGTVTGVQVGETQYGLFEENQRGRGVFMAILNYTFLIGSAVLLVWSINGYFKARQNLKSSEYFLEPLVPSQGVIA